MTAAKLTILVPVFNRFEKLSSLLADLEAQSWPAYDVLVIDHGTRDFPPPTSERVRVIKRSPEFWFTGAINEGLRHLHSTPEFRQVTSHVMLLNDDVCLPDRDFLKRMVERAQGKVLSSCMAVDPQGKVIYAGLTLDRVGARYNHLGTGRPVGDIVPGESLCDVLPTRGICFPLSTLDEVGFLAEHDLPQYGSDYEWTARAKRHGYTLVMLTATYVVTRVDDRPTKSSGRTRYATNKITGFLGDFRNPHRMGSLPVLRSYSQLVFRGPYRWYYLSINMARRILGFAYTNFFAKPPRQN